MIVSSLQWGWKGLEKREELSVLMSSVGKFWVTSSKSKLNFILPPPCYPLQFQSPEWKGLLASPRKFALKGLLKVERWRTPLSPAKARQGSP